MRIFLSYRREDAAAWAGRLRDALAQRFGEDNIFQDVVMMRPGENFAEVIKSAVIRSDVALAVIGPRWLTAASPDGEPRLNKADDYVHSELVTALALTKRVIPVLVGGASMPSAVQLPEDLKPFGLLHAVTLRDETWRRDVDDLVRALAGEAPKLRRPGWLIVVGLVVGLIVIGATTWRIIEHDGQGSGDLTTTTSPSATAAPSNTRQPRIMPSGYSAHVAAKRA